MLGAMVAGCGSVEGVSGEVGVGGAGVEDVVV